MELQTINYSKIGMVIVRLTFTVVVADLLLLEYLYQCGEATIADKQVEDKHWLYKNKQHVVEVCTNQLVVHTSRHTAHNREL
jgi:hypothetical protein